MIKFSLLIIFLLMLFKAIYHPWSNSSLRLITAALALAR